MIPKELEKRLKKLEKRICCIANSVPISILSGSALLEFPETLPEVTSDQDIPVPGAEVGDPVAIGITSEVADPNITYMAWVSAPGIVTIRLRNLDSLSSIDLPPATYTVVVFKV